MAADMNASLMANVELKSIATTGSASHPADNAAKELPAHAQSIIVPFASVQRDTLEMLIPSAVQNAMEMSIVPDQDPLASMESARILVMELVEPMPTATCVD